MADNSPLSVGENFAPPVPLGREVVTFPCAIGAVETARGVRANGGIRHDRHQDARAGNSRRRAGYGARKWKGKSASSCAGTSPACGGNPETDSDLVANNISSLLQRVAGTSVQEIDRLIAELQNLREMLSVEGARVQREIVQYATLSQSAMQSTKIIAESLSHWKKVPDAPSIRGG